MGLINRKNLISTICIVYTVLSLYKIIMESIAYKRLDDNYSNFLWMFAISVIATSVLALHYYLQRLPIWLVIIGQYLVLIGLISLAVWIQGHFVYLHPDAYSDMFWSITIPYVFGAAIYYYSFWNKVNKANMIIKDLKEKNRKEA